MNWLEEPEGLPSPWSAFLRSEAVADYTAGAVFPPRSLFLLDRPIPRADSGKLVGKAELAGVQGHSLPEEWRGDLSPWRCRTGPCCCGGCAGLLGGETDKMWLLHRLFCPPLNTDPVLNSFSRGQQKGWRQLLPRFCILLSPCQLRKGLPYFITFFVNARVEQHSSSKASFLEGAEQSQLELF